MNTPIRAHPMRDGSKPPSLGKAEAEPLPSPTKNLMGCGWCGCIIAEPKSGRCAACMQVFRAVFGGWAFIALFIPRMILELVAR